MAPQNLWILTTLLKSPGIIYGLTLLAFFGLETYLILMFSAEISSKLVLMSYGPRSDMVCGKQIIVDPRSGRPDHTQLYRFEKKPSPPSFDNESHLKCIFRLIEEGKF